jgi:hypothetical protein
MSDCSPSHFRGKIYHFSNIPQPVPRSDVKNKLPNLYHFPSFSEFSSSSDDNDGKNSDFPLQMKHISNKVNKNHDGSFLLQLPAHKFVNIENNPCSSNFLCENQCHPNSLSFQHLSLESNSFSSSNSDENSFSDRFIQPKKGSIDDYYSIPYHSQNIKSAFLSKPNSTLRDSSSSSDQIKNIFSNKKK